MRILVTDGVARAGVEALRQEAEVDVSRPLDEAQLLECIGKYDAIIVRSSTRVTARCIAQAKRLKVIGRAGAGVDNIDVQAATRQGVVVVNAPGGNSVAVAEHTIALLLCLARNIPQAHEHVKSGGWERSKFMGTEVRGKTLGLFGLGRAGAEVAKRALGLGMHVIAYDPAVAPERVSGLGVMPAEPSEILSKADFISLHVPVTPETVGLIGKDSIALMKPGVRIINCSRGEVVDESALIEALRTGKVAAAALDVFDSEPLRPGHPLLELDNVILTPHLGASTHEAQVNVALQTAAAVLAVLRGDPMTAAVNIPVPAAEESKELAPFFPLAEVLGRFGAQWSEGMIGRLHVAWRGRLGVLDTRPLLNYILKGFLSPLLHEQVNVVNAPLLAKERGIRVSELRAPDANDLPAEIMLTATTNRGERVVAGSLSARQEPRLVQIDSYRIDVAPVSYMLVCPHVDQPGIIGKVGTILGKAGVNISGMQVARRARGGDAIMILGVDCPATLEAVTEIARVDGVLSVKQIYLQ